MEATAEIRIPSTKAYVKASLSQGASAIVIIAYDFTSFANYDRQANHR